MKKEDKKQRTEDVKRKTKKEIRREINEFNMYTFKY